MPPKEVYKMHNGVCEKFKYKNFRTNLRNLRNKVAADRFAADKSKEAYENDKHLCAKPKDQFVWKGSFEQQLLAKDIRDGELDGMKPKQARKRRTIYEEMPVSVTQWRDLFWGEKRRYAKKQRDEELKEIIRMKNKKLFQKA